LIWLSPQQLFEPGEKVLELAELCIPELQRGSLGRFLPAKPSSCWLQELLRIEMLCRQSSLSRDHLSEGQSAPCVQRLDQGILAAS